MLPAWPTDARWKLYWLVELICTGDCSMDSRGAAQRFACMSSSLRRFPRALERRELWRELGFEIPLSVKVSRPLAVLSTWIHHSTFNRRRDVALVVPPFGVSNDT
eukprot:5767526-Amphidinium_carterae.1